MTPTRHRVNPAVYAALDKLGPMPVPFFVPDVEGEWVMHSETDAAKPQGERMSRDMRELASELVADLCLCGMEVCKSHCKQAVADLREKIEKALRSILPPPGHILDSEGVVRKVLGKPLITKDGVWIGSGCGYLWIIDPDPYYGVIPLNDVAPLDVSNCYSSREAAAAAATAGGEGER
jgi:hypothetical protein